MIVQKTKTLIVEDDIILAHGISSLVNGISSTFTVFNSVEACKALQSNQYDLVITDFDLSCESSGLDVIRLASSLNIPTIMLTSNDSKDIIKQAYTLGCKDYLLKRDIPNSLLRIVKKRLQLRRSINVHDMFFDKNALEQIQQVSEVDLRLHPLLLQGASGTGKSMLAQRIHQSLESRGNFVHINCAEIPENLLESELFGHIKGSFSGATSNRDGKFKLADKGTLFLDEIASLPLHLQAKLLTAIENKEFYPVGSDRPIKSDFSLITACHENLEQLVKEKSFRLDLYYRLKGIVINLPSLADCSSSFKLIVENILSKLPRKIYITDQALECLRQYNWRGNFRELNKVLGLITQSCSGYLEEDEVRKYLKPQNLLSTPLASIDAVKTNGLSHYIESLEKEIIEQYLSKNQGHVRDTMKDLKISSTKFYNRLKSH